MPTLLSAPRQTLCSTAPWRSLCGWQARGDHPLTRHSPTMQKTAHPTAFLLCRCCALCAVCCVVSYTTTVTVCLSTLLNCEKQSLVWARGLETEQRASASSRIVCILCVHSRAPHPLVVRHEPDCQAKRRAPDQRLCRVSRQLGRRAGVPTCLPPPSLCWCLPAWSLSLCPSCRRLSLCVH